MRRMLAFALLFGLWASPPAGAHFQVLLPSTDIVSADGERRLRLATAGMAREVGVGCVTYLCERGQISGSSAVLP